MDILHGLSRSSGRVPVAILPRHDLRQQHGVDRQPVRIVGYHARSRDSLLCKDNVPNKRQADEMEHHKDSQAGSMLHLLHHAYQPPVHRHNLRRNTRQTTRNPAAAATPARNVRRNNARHIPADAPIRLRSNEIRHGAGNQAAPDNIQVIRYRLTPLGARIHGAVPRSAMRRPMRPARFDTAVHRHCGRLNVGLRRQRPRRPYRPAFILHDDTSHRVRTDFLHLGIHQHLHRLRLLFPLRQHRDTGKREKDS